MGFMVLSDLGDPRDWLRKNKLWQKWDHYRNILDTTVTITAATVTVKAGAGEYKFVLPPEFQDHQYVHHLAEMVSWLRPQLQSDNIMLKRCRFIPDARQVYLGLVELPEMTPKEQRSWIRWEADRYVPFEPGSFVATLLSHGAPGEKTILLAAVPRERLTAWRQLIKLLGGDLRKIVILGPAEEYLTIHFDDEMLPGKKIGNYFYHGLTLLCLVTAIFLLLQGGYGWYQAKQALAETEKKILPFTTLQDEYRQSKKTEQRVHNLEAALTNIEKQTVTWHVLLKLFGEMIPYGCWLEKCVQQQGTLESMTLEGKATDLQKVLDFKARLEQTRLFASVLLLESCGRETEVNSAVVGAATLAQESLNRENTICFVLQLVLRSPVKGVVQ